MASPDSAELLAAILGAAQVCAVAPRDGAAPPGKLRRVPEGVAVVLETSGTTGSSKLVPLTHANLHAAADSVRRAFDLRAADRLLSLLPFTHMLGLACALAQLLAGGSVVCVDGFRADQFGEWLRAFRPTWFAAGPAVHRAVLKLAEESDPPLDTSSLRFVRSGTARLEPRLWRELERALGVPVINGYGLSEVGQVTMSRLSAGKPDSVGSSIGPDVGIMDDAGNLLPAGCEGEVVLRGEAVIAGYLDDPEGSAFHNGWFRTGDLGRQDGDGDLFLTGRRKEMINRGGETIAPLEIDAALAEHPAVSAAAAFAIPHATLGEDVAAAVVLRPGARSSESDLRQFLAARLARSKVPSRIVWVDQVPAGANGKPRRAALAQQFAAYQPAPAPAAPGELEQRIAEIWMRILGIGQPGSSDSFFALGGDSLSAAVMMTAVHRELRVDRRLLERADFFESPTVAALARMVEECGGAGSAATSADTPEIVLQARGAGTPFFCFPGESQDVYYLRHLARRMGEERPFVVLRHAGDGAGGLPALTALAERFVNHVRRLRPLGPYLLGGHCYGGVLAFECAQRLIALGEPVPLLALFDTPTPGYPKPMRHWKGYIKQAPRLFAALAKPAIRKEVAEHVHFLSERAASETIFQSYVARPFTGRIVHFLAGDAAVSSRVLEDARLGWRDFARGGCDVHRLGGRHDSMFEEQHAGELAGRLQAAIRSYLP